MLDPLCKKIPVARRVLGESHEFTLNMKKIYSRALFMDPGATLGDLREAVTTLDDVERTARRVFGSTHPDITGIEDSHRKSQAALRAREETQPSPGSG